MFVSDLRHFLDMPDDVPGPARRMGERLSLIVRAATAGDAGIGWVSALTCDRRPGHKSCPGHIALFRSDIPASIEWRCTACGDEGVISGWERSPFDLRRRREDPSSGDTLAIAIPSEVAATLRTLLLLDTTTERIVFQARASTEGIVLVTDGDDLDELTGYIAAEANHEHDRRRQKRLDRAFEVLNQKLQQAPRPGR